MPEHSDKVPFSAFVLSPRHPQPLSALARSKNLCHPHHLCDIKDVRSKKIVQEVQVVQKFKKFKMATVRDFEDLAIFQKAREL